MQSQCCCARRLDAMGGGVDLCRDFLIDKSAHESEHWAPHPAEGVYLALGTNYADTPAGQKKASPAVWYLLCPGCGVARKRGLRSSSCKRAGLGGGLPI